MWLSFKNYIDWMIKINELFKHLNDGNGIYTITKQMYYANIISI